MTSCLISGNNFLNTPSFSISFHFAIDFKNEYLLQILTDRTPKRIYFLAVDTQEEMKTWARMVCDACGLWSAPDDEEENGN